jgi:serine/threonine-protein kinase
MKVIAEKYEVVGMLGRGGMGMVLKARMRPLGRLVALKLLAPSEIMDMMVPREELERRFVSEAETMASLRHPAIAQVWDMDRDEKGRLFFTMEYLCDNLGDLIGETYEVEAPSRVLGLKRALHYTEQTLGGLACMHFAGMVHRDVKPFNLLLTSDDQVKIIDFGLSGKRGEGLAKAKGERVGSPYYSAPEQEEDPNKADARSDLYSVGVMFFRMLGGRLPSESCERISDCNTNVNPVWDDFFAKALHLDPAERFESAEEMRRVLLEKAAEDEEHLNAACSLEDMQALMKKGNADKKALRSSPELVRKDAALDTFQLDELWHPTEYAAPQLSEDGHLVSDAGTGLVWQREGSLYPMEAVDAVAYAERLNAEAFAGRRDWRLPTVPELMSILTPVRQGMDLCLPPVFGSDRKRLWSADTALGNKRWYADVDLGFIGLRDEDCRMFVRVVAGGDK